MSYLDENLIQERSKGFGMQHCCNCGSLEPVDELSENDLCAECEDDRAFKLTPGFISSLPNPVEDDE
jgi:hypothetical protein